MGQKYGQLSLQERCELAMLYKAGHSLRKISSIMGRSASTLAREIKRNRSSSRPYAPDHAHKLSAARRWRGSKLERLPDLRARVLERLAMGHSPQQVASRLALEHPITRISHESIYRFIDAQRRRTNNGAWRHYLPRAKSKRGKSPKRGFSSVNFIRNRISIHQRPAFILKRKQPGHWEADLMLFSKYSQAILAIQERSSRFLLMAKLPNKSSAHVATRILELLEPIPKTLTRTMTFDNGTEFCQHTKLQETGIRTYFCDTHSPWQKGGVENAIGRMRRKLPRKTDLDKLSDEDILHYLRLYNHTPRRCLGYKTPAEVFYKLLHFKCETISRPSPG